MKRNYDLIIIGGGIMGLMTAYYASSFTNRIIILEKATVGNVDSATNGLTRSYRSDYLDPLYARLAYESRGLYQQLEVHAEEPLLIECGCLNLAKESVTPWLDKTYAAQSFQVISRMKLRATCYATLDQQAGFLYVPAVVATIKTLLKKSGISVMEQKTVERIVSGRGKVQVQVNGEEFLTQSLVMTPGRWINKVLAKVEGLGSFQIPLNLEKPLQSRYILLPPKLEERYSSSQFPVFAYLDVGIYGHPVYMGKTQGLKVGYFQPPDFKTNPNPKIQNIEDFIRECLPELAELPLIDVTDVDQCFYDVVGDDDFVLGAVPGFSNIYMGAGWRGTGFKFAPWVGKTLAQLALQAGTVYDINRFQPSRFIH